MIEIEIHRAADRLIEASAARMEKAVAKGEVKSSDIWPCYICGRYVNGAKAMWIHVINGGSFARESDEPYEESGDLGGHPVGKDCLKKQRALLAIAKSSPDF